VSSGNLKILSGQEKKRAPVYTGQALERLCQYHWPGNVRELKNLVKRMVILRPGERITGTDINLINNTKRKRARLIILLAEHRAGMIATLLVIV